MAYIESFLTSQDGLALRTQHWTPATPPKAAVLITHGHGEHSGRYGHVAEALIAAGYAVYAHDLRGHGKSGGPRGHIPGYESFMGDVQQMWDWMKRENPTLKRFLYGHSMGGQITLNFALRRQPEAVGVIASAPWLVLAYQPPAWKVWLAKVMANLQPTFTQSTELDTAVKMAHDEAHLNSLPDLNLTHTFMSARLGFDVLRNAEVALARATEFRYPLLLLHGEADNVISPSGSKQFHAHAASTDKTLKLYRDMFHEVHNETDRALVLREVVAWLDAHR